MMSRWRLRQGSPLDLTLIAQHMIVLSGFHIRPVMQNAGSERSLSRWEAAGFLPEPSHHLVRSMPTCLTLWRGMQCDAFVSTVVVYMHSLQWCW